MGRSSVLVPVLAVASIGLLAAGRVAPGAAAQEATPPAGAEEVPAGVTFEPLGFGTADELPAAPADFVLVRLTVEPGAGFPIEADDPSVALAYVEAGALTVTVDAPIRVTRAATIAAFATPGAAEAGAVPGPEEVAAGAEFTLAAGDSAFFPANVPGEVRNDGQERAVALVAILAPPEAMATPAP
jgi:quercetin dioxygenase-like cupin family protein